MTDDKPKRELSVPKAQVEKGGALVALVPANIEETFRLADALSRSGEMIPKHFQGKPEATMAAIVRGMEIGLAPMQALSNIAVINGRACLWGDALNAIVQRHGHHIDVLVEGEGEDMKAVATLTRGDTGQKIVREFSMADAKKANLAGKQGPWQQYPKRMLMHRARSWAVRDGAADALMGLQVAEEVHDYQPMRDVTPEEPEPRTGGFAQRVKAAQEDKPVEDAPEAEDEPVDETQQDSDPAPDEPEPEPLQDESDPITEMPEYAEGQEAARGDFISRDQCPHDEDPARGAWLLGFDDVAGREQETGGLI